MTKRRDKGMGTVYFRESDKKWVGSIELPPDPMTGKRRKKSVVAKGKTEVQRRLGELRRAYEINGDLATKTVTMRAWMVTWLNDIAATRLKPSTLSEYKSKNANYIEPRLGSRRVDKLTPSDLLNLYKWMTAPVGVGLGLSTTTARQVHAILRKSLGDAVKHGLVSRNVAALVDPPRKAVVERPTLTADQAIKLMSRHIDDPYVVRFMLGLITGCRQGEALGLTCDNVLIYSDREGNVTGGVVTFAWSLQRITYKHGCGMVCGKARAGSCPLRVADIEPGVEGVQVAGGLWLLRPKTKGSYREVYLPAFLAAGLAQVIGARTEGLVFRQPSGAPISPRMDWQVWKDWLKEAGLPDVPVHSMRHTTATLLYALKVDEVTRMAIMGHTSAVTTRIYTHKDLSLQQSALDSLAGLLGMGEGGSLSLGA